MKATDIGGAAAILIAGFILGKDYDKGDYTPTDLFFIVALLAVGYYLAVYLS